MEKEILIWAGLIVGSLLFLLAIMAVSNYITNQCLEANKHRPAIEAAMVCRVLK